MLSVIYGRGKWSAQAPTWVMVRTTQNAFQASLLLFCAGRSWLELHFSTPRTLKGVAVLYLVGKYETISISILPLKFSDRFGVHIETQTDNSFTDHPGALTDLETDLPSFYRNASRQYRHTSNQAVSPRPPGMMTGTPLLYLGVCSFFLGGVAPNCSTKPEKNNDK